MTFNKIKKEDFKKYQRQFWLCSIYSLVLAIVYSCWFLETIKVFYIGAIIFIGFILLGFVVFYLWTNSLKNKEKGELK